MPLSFALRTLRARKGSFAGAFLALFCAAVLITACGALLETGLRGEIRTERFAAAPIVVAGDQNVHQDTVKEKKGKTKVKHKAKPLAERVWLPASSTDRLAAVPGVGAVIPELTFPAQLLKTDDRPTYGHSWASAALTPATLAEGRAPQAADEVVLDRGLAARRGLRVGDRVTVRSTQAPAEYRISGLANARLAEQGALFFSEAETVRLAAHPGQVSVIGVLPRPGVDPKKLAKDLAPALAGTGATVHLGADRGPVEFLDAANARIRLVSMGGAIGGTALLVAVLVVTGTFALGIQQRAREIALLRAVAVTPRQLRRMIGREALLIGLAGGLLGSVAGLPVAYWLHGRFVELGAVPATLQVSVGFFPMAAAVLAAVLGGWSAARLSARRAARIRPVEALAEAAVTDRGVGGARMLAGLLVLAGGVTLAAVLTGLDTEAGATPVTFLTVIVLAVVVSLLGPLLGRIAAAVIGTVLRGSRVSGHLAAANLRTDPRRLAAAAVPLTLLIAMVCTVLFAGSTLGSAATRQAADGSRARWTLVATAPGVPAEAAAAVRALPGVTAVTETVRTTVRIGLEKYTAQGVTTRDLTESWDPGVTSGSLAGFGDGDIALSERAAKALGSHPGDTLRLTLGDGTPAALSVRAVYSRGLGFGDLTMSHALVSGHVDDPLSPAVAVAAGTGVTKDRLDAAVARFPGVVVLDRAGAGRLAAEVQQSNVEVNHLAMGLVLAFTAISVVNTLAMSTAGRAREFALLRLTGTTRRQVLRMLRLEALGVVATGVVLGSGIALVVLTAFSLGMTGTAAPSWGWTAYGAVLALAGALALAATALPGRLALRERPAEALGRL
ncbi:FtsX-like permease family protein [Kitasatospora atroaurantiaca]|uniref:Putative ABC transport system permease protein n=1 Tax=Kitasatospora atroaurantiaca TaxID=285545 RepID=A0A561ET74_9ACTN|nr:ABC transporter permease [Kitasatospora atroaurantiaca]TWE18787.1 putative ABC transport system permease protein [Kitasatospora atroaurantiaca]